MIQISVIVPTFNESGHIGLCVDALFKQTLSKEKYEIIVVDNGSTDDTVSIVNKKGIAPLILPKKNVGAVRNQGALNAIGELLVFIDGDCIAPANWLEIILNNYYSNPNTVFGGGVLLPDNAGWIEKDWLLEGKNGPSLPRDLIGAAIACPKSLFKKVSGFDESVTSGEDTNFSRKLAVLGVEIKILPILSVVHLGNAKTLSQFFYRQAWHGENYFKKLPNSVRDIIFWLTILYGASILSIFILPLINYYYFIFSIATPPAALTLKRLNRAKLKEFNFLRIIRMFALDNLYLMGRFFGSIRAVITQVKRRIQSS